MGEIKLFEKEAFGKVRVVIHNGEPWFIAKDLCECLGLENISEALRGLDEDEKITLSNPDGNPRAGIPHQMNVVSESGLYSLVIRSRKPEAKAFKRWVTHEVLPSIRKTGQYGGIPDFTDPVAAARAWADAMEAKRNLEQRNEQLVNTVTDLATVTTALRDALGNSIDWKSVTAIPWLREYFADASTRTCSIIGKFLTMLSEFRGYTVRDVPDSEWGSVHAYHKDMVDEFRRLLDERPDFMVELRKKQN